MCRKREDGLFLSFSVVGIAMIVRLKISEGSRWKSDDFRRATEAPPRPPDSGKTMGVGMTVGNDVD